jgi:hypothetical protein
MGNAKCVLEKFYFDFLTLGNLILLRTLKVRTTKRMKTKQFAENADNEALNFNSTFRHSADKAKKVIFLAPNFFALIDIVMQILKRLTSR